MMRKKIVKNMVYCKRVKSKIEKEKMTEVEEKWWKRTKRGQDQRRVKETRKEEWRKTKKKEKEEDNEIV